jgi:hypothetical protein
MHTGNTHTILLECESNAQVLHDLSPILSSKKETRGKDASPGRFCQQLIQQKVQKPARPLEHPRVYLRNQDSESLKGEIKESPAEPVNTVV